MFNILFVIFNRQSGAISFWSCIFVVNG